MNIWLSTYLCVTLCLILIISIVIACVVKSNRHLTEPDIVILGFATVCWPVVGVVFLVRWIVNLSKRVL